MLDACQDHRPPCQGTDADLWTSEDHEDRQQAAEACGYCPHTAACHEYAATNRERAGVWGGRDRTAQPATTRRSA
ncbi:WhiB family transcriptional regulator [Aquipuribacter sp. SD81]|uniref:WhiB family transcriptional regulator n=1 Tax=Aquipuribacter sp. SD81 TaxID=3127703 RepID=UPI0030161AC4